MQILTSLKHYKTLTSLSCAQTHTVVITHINVLATPDFVSLHCAKQLKY